uniref:F-box domain-containing protein n=1 Tax=Glossina brevipalpis TaxID=37001 RepID=A0A1A9WUD6_9MUSC
MEFLDENHYSPQSEYNINLMNMDIMDNLAGSSVRCDDNAPVPELSNEIWIKILNELRHADLMQASLACKHWHQMACIPKLKRKSKLIITEVLEIKWVHGKYLSDSLENLPKENRLKSIALDITENDDDLLLLVLQKWSNSLECIDLVCDEDVTSAKQLKLTSAKICRLKVLGCKQNPEDLIHYITPKMNKTLTELTLS